MYVLLLPSLSLVKNNNICLNFLNNMDDKCTNSLEENKAHLSERKRNRSLKGSKSACFNKIRSARIMLASPQSTWKETHLVNTGIFPLGKGEQHWVGI